MRFAYDRFGAGRYTHNEPDYRNPRAGYRNSSTRGSVGLEGAMTEMPETNYGMNNFEMPAMTEPPFKAPSGAMGQYRAI